jgi:hypothetical protein
VLLANSVVLQHVVAFFANFTVVFFRVELQTVRVHVPDVARTRFGGVGHRVSWVQVQVVVAFALQTFVLDFGVLEAVQTGVLHTAPTLEVKAFEARNTGVTVPLVQGAVLSGVGDTSPATDIEAFAALQTSVVGQVLVLTVGHLLF